MKLRNKSVFFIISLIILVFIMFLNSTTVYANTDDFYRGTTADYGFYFCGFMCSEVYTEDTIKDAYIDMDKFEGGRAEIYTFGYFGEILKTEYATKMQEASDGGFINLDFLDTVRVTYYTHYIYDDYTYAGTGGDFQYTSKGIKDEKHIEDFNILTAYEGLSRILNDVVSMRAVEVDFCIKGRVYRIHTYTKNTYCALYETAESSLGGSFQDYVDEFIVLPRNSDVLLSSEDLDNDVIPSLEYNMYRNALLAFKYLKGKAVEGLVAGSVGAGYNVGVPYSEKQIPLSDALEYKDGFYDFKNLEGIEFAISYYYNPIFGKFYVNTDPKIPQSDEAWFEYGKNVDGNTLVDGDSVKILPDFMEFTRSLSADYVNERGEKISDNVKIEGGAKRLTSIGTSKDPKTVLSYNMQMAVPYFYVVNNGRGRLLMSNLRILNTYTLCLYNFGIYENSTTSSTMTKISTLNDSNGLGVDIGYAYLYYQNVEMDDGKNVKTGVVVIASYDEAIADTTPYKKNVNLPKPSGEIDKTTNIYLTGRKIRFDGGYSDNIYFNEANASLVSVQGLNSTRDGYLPLNVAFPLTNIDLNAYNFLQSFSGSIDNQTNKELANAVKDIIRPKTNEEMYEYIYTSSNHGKAPQNFQAAYMFIDIGVIRFSNDGVVDANSDENGKFSIYIIRNNAYVNDESLLSWLRTDTARGIPYVDADKLIALITGDFSDSLKPITYKEWKRMQEIKEELAVYKENGIVRFVTTFSMVLGVILMIFAILFIVFYWFDVLNTFTDFSILKFISFGHLYPVSSNDMKEYIRNDSKVKLVNFKEICIIAGIMLLIGYFLTRLDYIMYFIIKLYQFILRKLGGRGIT